MTVRARRRRTAAGGAGRSEAVAAAEAMELATARHGGVRYYDDGRPDEPGTDPSFLLLHGLGTSLDFWTAVAPGLAGTRRTVAVDLPGFGLSAEPAGGLGLDQVVRRMVEFIEAIGLRSCVVVGHSMGGIIALRLAAELPEIVERVVLVNATLLTAFDVRRSPGRAVRHPVLTAALLGQFLGASIPMNRRRAAFLVTLPFTGAVALRLFVASRSSIDPALFVAALAHTGGGVVLDAWRSSRDVDVAALMAAARQPVDLVWGKRDLLVSPGDLRRARELLDVRRELPIEDCGHWPMIERPAALAAFLAAIGGPRDGAWGRRT